jgi:hypothetical protein
VLTGRWGDTRVPEQLVYEYSSKKCRALAVVSFSTVCPLARRLVPKLNQLHAQYDSQGVQFIALFPNATDDLSAISRYAVECDLQLPVLQDDPANPWYEQLGLATTPEVVLLDVSARDRVAVAPDGPEQRPAAADLAGSAFRVVYRGQVDGSWFGGRASAQSADYLADAIDQLLAGKAPKLAQTAASGCAIVKQAPRDLSRFESATYHRDIARLMQRRCLACHREGEPGAELFSALDTYETVAALREVILSRVENRLMPPWRAATDPANGLGGFQNDPSLSDDEIDLLRAWVEHDCPIGDPADAPPPLPASDPQAWRIGEPDLVFKMPEPYRVPRTRLDEYQYYRIPANFSEDRYIQAIEMRPGNKAVVHHMGAIVGQSSVRAKTANQAMLELYGLTGDEVRKIGDYISGDPFNARTYPPGYALRLPAGHDLFFEMHYTPTGREEAPDVSQMAIRWASAPPQHVLETKVFNRKDLRIAPHENHYEKISYHAFATDVLIHALGPHMHFRGKDFTLYHVENPQTQHERRTLVLCVPAYDFNWQWTYEFVHPIRLKAGDALLSITHFDNSYLNPFNPDPDTTVRFGLKSDEEMCNLRVKYETTVLEEHSDQAAGDTPPTQSPRAAAGS